MKQFLFMLMALPIIANAQNKMTGLGVFKFDSTKSSIIDSISQQTEVKIIKSYKSTETGGDDTYYQNTTSKIFLVSKTDEKDEYGMSKHPDPSYIDNPDVLVYYINYYNLSGIHLRRLYLFFYKSVLYKIDCYPDNELVEAMDLKYGKRDIEIKEKKVTCRSGMGIEYTEVEKTYFQTWKLNNPNVYCLSITSTYFDNKCKKNTILTFTANSVKTEKLVDNLVEDAKKNKEKDELDKKKQKLKDF